MLFYIATFEVLVVARIIKEILGHDAVWIRKYLRRFRRSLLLQSSRWSKITTSFVRKVLRLI
jgi:hypothetical protein